MPLRLPAKRHKYSARPVTVDGIRFASTKEANRFLDLRLLEKAGQIRNLQLQPRFDLLVPSPAGVPVKVGHMTLDFSYEELSTLPDGSQWRDGFNGALVYMKWQQVYEEVKGGSATKTTAYRLRKRMVEATHGVVIREV